MDFFVKGKKYRWIIFLLSLATVCGITLNLDMSTTTDPWIIKYIDSMGGFSMTNIILFAGLCMLYYFVFLFLRKKTFSWIEKIWILIPSFLFANFMTWGYSFEKTNSYDLILSCKVQMLKAFTMIIAYFILFSAGIACLYRFLDNVDIQNQGNRVKNTYVKWFYKYPFLTPFLTMMICYIPYIILSYPAIFMGDTRPMICQGYNFPSSAINGVVLLDENVFMTGKHAVIYPVFLNIFLRLSKAVFNNYNVGAFAVAMLQLVSILAVVSSALKYMVKQNIRFGIIFVVMIYFIISPRVQSYMFLITKDVFSSCLLLVFFVIAYKLYQHEEYRNWKHFIWLWLSASGVGLVRNDGKIVIFLALIVMIIFMGKSLRKQLLLVTITFLMVVMSFTKILMPALKITPVSSRAMFSIPFQQTARYVKEYGDEVTEEEKEAINKILSYDELAELYTPQRSDAVKNTYKPEATKADLIQYFKAWLQMFLKHPGVYFEATMNNYFYYVYPGEKPADLYSYEYSLRVMEARIGTDKYLQTIDMSIRHPQELDEARALFESLRESIFSLPVLNLLRCPAAFVWVFILLICYLMKNKRWSLLAVMAPVFFSLLVCFASPCNGIYFRYLYCVVLCLPIVVVFGLMGNKNAAEEAEIQECQA